GAAVGFVGFLAFATDMMMTFADKPTTVVALDFCVRLMARLLSCSGADILRLLVHISARKGSGRLLPGAGLFFMRRFPIFSFRRNGAVRALRSRPMAKWTAVPFRRKRATSIAL